MQGTQVRSLIQEDLICRGATKPTHQNYWAHAPQLLSPRTATTEVWAPKARALQQEKPPKLEARTLQQSPRLLQLKPACNNEGPIQPKN